MTDLTRSCIRCGRALSLPQPDAPVVARCPDCRHGYRLPWLRAVRARVVPPKGWTVPFINPDEFREPGRDTRLHLKVGAPTHDGSGDAGLNELVLEQFGPWSGLGKTFDVEWAW